MRFGKHFVAKNGIKARVSYNLDNRVDGRKCVTIYAKDYDRSLGRIFQELYKNDTDTQSDYFDKGRVTLFEDHPMYKAVRIFVETLRRN